jgi:hypothetical protein
VQFFTYEKKKKKKHRLGHKSVARIRQVERDVLAHIVKGGLDLGLGLWFIIIIIYYVNS